MPEKSQWFDAKGLPRACQPGKYAEGMSIDWGTAIVQPMLRGVRCLLTNYRGGAEAYDARGKKLTKIIPSIVRAVGKVLHKGSFVDGVLYTTQLPWEAIQRACRRLSKLSGALEYHICDVTGDNPYSERYPEFTRALCFTSCARLRTVPTVKVRSETELRVAQRTFMGQGYDGVALRHGAQGYDVGPGLSKFVLTLDDFVEGLFAIVDWKPARSRRLPLFLCETKEGEEFEVTAHQEMWAEDVEDAVGKQLRLKHRGLSKTKVPLAPIALSVEESK